MGTNLLLKSQIVKIYGNQSNFAEAAGIDETYVSKIVRMRRVLPEKEARRWAELLAWSGHYLELFDETWG